MLRRLRADEQSVPIDETKLGTLDDPFPSCFSTERDDDIGADAEAEVLKPAAPFLIEFVTSSEEAGRAEQASAFVNRR